MTVKDALAAGVSFSVAPDGTISQIHPPEGQEKLQLPQLQEAVGGYIEMVPIRVAPRSWKMFVNEDGLRLQLPFNPHATALCAVPGTAIVGTAVLTRNV